MRDFIDKTSTQNGTPINRDYLMALQGFDGLTITVGENVITEEGPYGIRTITISDEAITEVFVGKKSGKRIEKMTTFYEDEQTNTTVIEEEIVL